MNRRALPLGIALVAAVAYAALGNAVSHVPPGALDRAGATLAGVGVALIPRLALSRVRPGIVVRKLAPRSPERKVVAATTARPGVAPAARTMIRVLSDVARRYTDAHLSVVSPAAAAS